MDFSSRASGELFLTVSNIVTSDKRVVTSKTIRPESFITFLIKQFCYQFQAHQTWHNRRYYQKAAPRNNREQSRRQIVFQQVAFDLSWQSDV